MGNIIAKKSVLQNYRSINYYFVANPTKIILACQEFTLEKKKKRRCLYNSMRIGEFLYNLANPATDS
jgi:hypothetical protein